MPAASIPAPSMISTATPSSAWARSASAVGVSTFPGRFWRSRARLTAATTVAAWAAAALTSWWAERSRASRPAGSSSSPEFLNSRYVYAASSVPSTSPPTCASETWCGTSQQSVLVPSSLARDTTPAAATRARSGSKAERAPSPATM